MGVGYLILHPVTMFIYQWVFDLPVRDFGGTVGRPWLPLFLSFDLPMMEMGFYFVLLGGLLGLGSGLYYRSLSRKNLLLERQERELRRNVLSLIEEGENERVEFKSSLRWDFRRGKVNKDLELSVLKSIAGFMNVRGGTLIIGVDDRGEITGIEKDCVTLKRRNRDGFEQCIGHLISDHLGADLCSQVRLTFHRIDEREVCRIYVEPSPRPVYLQNGRDVRYYLRAGNSTRELNVEEAIHHVSSR